MLQRLNPSRKWEFFFLSAHTVVLWKQLRLLIFLRINSFGYFSHVQPTCISMFYIYANLSNQNDPTLKDTKISPEI